MKTGDLVRICGIYFRVVEEPEPGEDVLVLSPGALRKMMAAHTETARERLGLSKGGIACPDERT